MSYNLLMLTFDMDLSLRPSFLDIELANKICCEIVRKKAYNQNWNSYLLSQIDSRQYYSFYLYY